MNIPPLDVEKMLAEGRAHHELLVKAVMEKNGKSREEAESFVNLVLLAMSLKVSNRIMHAIKKAVH